MKVAVIGSRNLTIDHLEKYLPPQTEEIVSGGAKGIDQVAKHYAQANDLPLTEFLPDYTRFKKGAPLQRNLQIIQYADYVLAFWDGKSHGTKFVIDECIKQEKPITVYVDGNVWMQSPSV